MIDAELSQRIDPFDNSPTGVSVVWQLPQLVLITAAEVLVSATGLEFAYSQAPASMRGTILALFYLAVFLGDTLYGTMQSLPLTTLQSILMFACLMSFAGWVFTLLAWRYVPSRTPGPV
jgi:dipeptide/tripeptide permease